jgi:hypothetical protein
VDDSDEEEEMESDGMSSTEAIEVCKLVEQLCLEQNVKGLGMLSLQAEI